MSEEALIAEEACRLAASFRTQLYRPPSGPFAFFGGAGGTAAVAEGVHHGLPQGHPDEDRPVRVEAPRAAHAHGQVLDVIEGRLTVWARPQDEPGRPGPAAPWPGP